MGKQKNKKKLLCNAPFGDTFHPGKHQIGIQLLSGTIRTKLKALRPDIVLLDDYSICLLCHREIKNQFDLKFTPNVNVPRSFFSKVVKGLKLGSDRTPSDQNLDAAVARNLQVSYIHF